MNEKMHIISYTLYKYYALITLPHNIHHTFNIMMCLYSRTLIFMENSVHTQENNKKNIFLIQWIL